MEGGREGGRKGGREGEERETTEGLYPHCRCKTKHKINDLFTNLLFAG